jgi:glycosyltransferase involved in cell wall biosynthesis
VGQAQELVEDGRNGLLADVEDVEGLAALAARVREDSGLRDRLRAEGRVTAEAYEYQHLDSAWDALLTGFVERPSAVDER